MAHPALLVPYALTRRPLRSQASLPLNPAVRTHPHPAPSRNPSRDRPFLLGLPASFRGPCPPRPSTVHPTTHYCPRPETLAVPPNPFTRLLFTHARSPSLSRPPPSVPAPPRTPVQSQHTLRAYPHSFRHPTLLRCRPLPSALTQHTRSVATTSVTFFCRRPSLASIAFPRAPVRANSTQPASSPSAQRLLRLLSRGANH